MGARVVAVAGKREGEQKRRRRKKKKAYLPISNLPEALKHLLRRILIFGHGHHEPNELLEGHVSAPARYVPKGLLHLPLVVHQAQAR